MADVANGSGTTVTDHRSAPRGVLPRRIQTWIMAGIAGVMVLIMFVAGRPQSAARSTTIAAPTAAPSADRLREYQDRLRLMETRAAQETQAAINVPTVPQPAMP